MVSSHADSFSLICPAFEISIVLCWRLRFSASITALKWIHSCSSVKITFKRCNYSEPFTAAIFTRHSRKSTAETNSINDASVPCSCSLWQWDSVDNNTRTGKQAELNGMQLFLMLSRCPVLDTPNCKKKGLLLISCDSSWYTRELAVINCHRFYFHLISLTGNCWHRVLWIIQRSQDSCRIANISMLTMQN